MVFIIQQVNGARRPCQPCRREHSSGAPAPHRKIPSSIALPLCLPVSLTAVSEAESPVPGDCHGKPAPPPAPFAVSGDSVPVTDPRRAGRSCGLGSALSRDTDLARGSLSPARDPSRGRRWSVGSHPQGGAQESWGEILISPGHGIRGASRFNLNFRQRCSSSICIMPTTVRAEGSSVAPHPQGQVHPRGMKTLPQSCTVSSVLWVGTTCCEITPRRYVSPKYHSWHQVPRCPSSCSFQGLEVCSALSLHRRAAWENTLCSPRSQRGFLACHEVPTALSRGAGGLPGALGRRPQSRVGRKQLHSEGGFWGWWAWAAQSLG